MKEILGKLSSIFSNKNKNQEEEIKISTVDGREQTNICNQSGNSVDSLINIIEVIGEYDLNKDEYKGNVLLEGFIDITTNNKKPFSLINNGEDIIVCSGENEVILQNLDQIQKGGSVTIGNIVITRK